MKPRLAGLLALLFTLGSSVSPEKEQLAAAQLQIQEQSEELAEAHATIANDHRQLSVARRQLSRDEAITVFMRDIGRLRSPGAPQTHEFAQAVHALVLSPPGPLGLGDSAVREHDSGDDSKMCEDGLDRLLGTSKEVAADKLGALMTACKHLRATMRLRKENAQLMSALNSSTQQENTTQQYNTTLKTNKHMQQQGNATQNPAEGVSDLDSEGGSQPNSTKRVDVSKSTHKSNAAKNKPMQEHVQEEDVSKGKAFTGSGGLPSVLRCPEGMLDVTPQRFKTYTTSMAASSLTIQTRHCACQQCCHSVEPGQGTGSKIKDDLPLVESLFSAEATGGDSTFKAGAQDKRTATNLTTAEFLTFKDERDKVATKLKTECSKERNHKLLEHLKVDLERIVPQVMLERRGCPPEIVKKIAGTSPRSERHFKSLQKTIKHYTKCKALLGQPDTLLSGFLAEDADEVCQRFVASSNLSLIKSPVFSFGNASVWPSPTGQQDYLNDASKQRLTNLLEATLNGMPSPTSGACQATLGAAHYASAKAESKSPFSKTPFSCVGIGRHFKKQWEFGCNAGGRPASMVAATGKHRRQSRRKVNCCVGISNFGMQYKDNDKRCAEWVSNHNCSNTIVTPNGGTVTELCPKSCPGPCGIRVGEKIERSCEKSNRPLLFDEDANAPGGGLAGCPWPGNAKKNMPPLSHLMRFAPCFLNDFPICAIIKVTQAKDSTAQPLVTGYGTVLPPANGTEAYLRCRSFLDRAAFPPSVLEDQVKWSCHFGQAIPAAGLGKFVRMCGAKCSAYNSRCRVEVEVSTTRKIAERSETAKASMLTLELIDSADGIIREAVAQLRFEAAQERLGSPPAPLKFPECPKPKERYIISNTTLSWATARDTPLLECPEGYSRVVSVEECSSDAVREAMARYQATQLMSVRADEYVYGEDGSNKCPAGSQKMITKSQCRNIASHMNAGFTEISARDKIKGSREPGQCSLKEVHSKPQFKWNPTAGVGVVKRKPVCTSLGKQKLPFQKCRWRCKNSTHDLPSHVCETDDICSRCPSLEPGIMQLLSQCPCGKTMTKTEKFPFVAWTARAAKACTERPCWEPCEPPEKRWEPYTTTTIKTDDIGWQIMTLGGIIAPHGSSRETCLQHCKKAIKTGKTDPLPGNYRIPIRPVPPDFTLCSHTCPGKCYLRRNSKFHTIHVNRRMLQPKAIAGFRHKHSCPSAASILVELDIKDAVAEESEINEVQRLLSLNPNKGNLTHPVQCEKTFLSVKTKGCVVARTDRYGMINIDGSTLEHTGFSSKEDVTRAAFFGDPNKVVQPKDFASNASVKLNFDYPYFFRQAPATLNSQYGLYYSTCDNGWTAADVAYVCKRDGGGVHGITVS